MRSSSVELPGETVRLRPAWSSRIASMSAVLVAGLTGSALGAVMVGDLLADQGGWLTWALFVAATALSLWCTVRAALVHVDATPTELRCAGILRDRWLPWAEITGIEIYVDRRGHPVSASLPFPTNPSR